MGKGIWLLLLALFVGVYAKAAFVSKGDVVRKSKNEELVAEATVKQQMEGLLNRQLNWFEKWQVKRMEKRLAKGKPRGPFSEREELTEGFRALPFFGSLLTLGLLAIVLGFTAEDNNVVRWANWGGLVAWATFLAIRLAAY
jgi:hypothetical protein